VDKPRDGKPVLVDKVFVRHGRQTLYLRLVAWQRHIFPGKGHVFWKPPKSGGSEFGPQEGSQMRSDHSVRVV
jgi:hypothetical protein